MSLYTTEVRYIVGQAYLNSIASRDPKALTEVSVDTQIARVWNIILPFNAPESDGFTNQKVASVILKHYWMREIGLETVGLWKHKITTRLEEIIPKYKMIWDELQSAGSIWDTVAITETGKLTKTGELHDERDSNTTSNGDSTSNTNGNSTNKSKFSDTPQNGLQAVEEGNYLTNYTFDENVLAQNNTANVRQTSDIMDNLNRNTKDIHDNTVTRTGFEGDRVSTMFMYSQQAVNVFEMIIKDVAPYFMGILG